MSCVLVAQLVARQIEQRCGFDGIELAVVAWPVALFTEVCCAVALPGNATRNSLVSGWLFIHFCSSVAAGSEPFPEPYF